MVNLTPHDRNTESVDIHDIGTKFNFIMPIITYHCITEMTEDETPVGHAAPFNHLRRVCVIIQMKQHLHQKSRVLVTGLILGLGPASERRRYKVTPSLIGWAQT